MSASPQVIRHLDAASSSPIARSSAERARTLRNLLKSADTCRLMLTQKERDVIAEAIELYESVEE